jgi:septum formation protein
MKADIDEKAIRHEAPQRLVLDLAHAKADAILAQLQQQQQGQQQGQQRPGVQAAQAQQQGGPTNAGSSSSSSSSSRAVGGYLITCDQVVVHEGRIREKPEDAAEARA